MARSFFRSYTNVFSKRWKVFVLLNMMFFDCVFLGVLLGQFLYTPLPYVDDAYWVLRWLRSLDWSWMILAIFFFNLFWSGVVVLTLPGLVFFPLSTVVLVLRGISWGIMLNQPSIVPFLLVLPTFVLEGEGYVLASVAGTVLGLSWLKTNWIYKDKHLSRLDALKNALREALRLLFLSAIFLFLAAVVETLTIKSA